MVEPCDIPACKIVKGIKDNKWCDQSDKRNQYLPEIKRSEKDYTYNYQKIKPDNICINQGSNPDYQRGIKKIIGYTGVSVGHYKPVNRYEKQERGKQYRIEYLVAVYITAQQYIQGSRQESSFINEEQPGIEIYKVNACCQDKYHGKNNTG